jgi:prenyltransferase beta subunit
MKECVARALGVLDTDARKILYSAVKRRRGQSGGFCGLDGQDDIYYTFFAILMLDVYGEKSLCNQSLRDWVRNLYPSLSGVDRVCAELILLRLNAISRMQSRLKLLRFFRLRYWSDSYKSFLAVLLIEQLFPEWCRRLALVRAGRAVVRETRGVDFSVLSTAGAVVRMVLTASAGEQDAAKRMLELVRRRHCASGGYAAAPGGSADLLSTAVAIFGCAYINEELKIGANDRAFVEMCWQDDGLFSATPEQRQGDLEHSYYALLALGAMV